VIPDPAPPYTVDLSGIARDEIRALLVRAAQLHLTNVVVPVLQDIGERLRMRPTKWGDPLYHLRHLKATAYRGVLQPLVEYYSLHDRIPIVTLWHVRPMVGQPLAPPDNGY
jgi:hypothetical protein